MSVLRRIARVRVMPLCGWIPADLLPQEWRRPKVVEPDRSRPAGVVYDINGVECVNGWGDAPPPWYERALILPVNVAVLWPADR